MENWLQAAPWVDPMWVAAGFIGTLILWVFAMVFTPKSLTLTMGLGHLTNAFWCVLSFLWLAFPSAVFAWVASGIVSQIIPLWVCVHANTLEDRRERARQKRFNEPLHERCEVPTVAWRRWSDRYASGLMQRRDSSRGLMVSSARPRLRRV